MKNNIRNIKRRLYRLSLIGNHLSRIKHFRGHGVHSPFVYGLVRSVFMTRQGGDDAPSQLVSSLTAVGISKRRAVQIEGAMRYCGATCYSIDALEPNSEFCILSPRFATEMFEELYKSAADNHATLVICQPYAERERHKEVMRLIGVHQSTSVDNRSYIIFFNNKLPKQHFVL